MYYRYILLAFFIIFLDQIIKYFVLTALSFGEVIKLIPFFNLTLSYNLGAAFGMLANQNGWQIWVFLIIAFVVSIFILFWLKKSTANNKKLESFSLALVLGGALGNVIDRLFRGYVVDFIDFYVGDWHWDTFNIADTAICVGAFLLILELFVFQRKRAN